MALAVCIFDTSGGRWMPLPAGHVLIGRAADCDIRLEDGVVSRHHAVLRVKDGRVWVRDLDSRNGTTLAATPVDGEREWRPGEQLSVASIIFELSESDEAHAGAAGGLFAFSDERATAPPLAELSVWDGRPLPGDDIALLVVARR